jgi:hypothetical protein
MFNVTRGIIPRVIKNDIYIIILYNQTTALYTYIQKEDYKNGKSKTIQT